MIKKILKNTIGVAIGGVGMGAANKIDSPLAPALSMSMGAGMVKEVATKKKGGVNLWE